MNEETSEEINGEEKQRTINSHEFLQNLKKSRKYSNRNKGVKEKNHITPDTHTHKISCRL